LFSIQDYNAKDLVRVFQQRLERRPCLKLVAKAADCWASWPSSQQHRQCSTCTADNIDLVYELLSHKSG